ncbi:MAG: type II toxin-antitoxin system death-on-curing family toxin [Hyphomicrobiaceae bacterium]|nr:type II toxin-antitoxin system death-on-curing family toxin [Hyphomicrobiaceae bacterium]
MSAPVWLELDEIYAIHEALLARYGGAVGVRDDGLLQSALARPQQLFSYEKPAPDLCALAAAYTTGIVKNHPFVDGNKRTGFIAAYSFLGSNGLELTASEVEAASMVIALAAGEMDERTFAQWLRERS